MGNEIGYLFYTMLHPYNGFDGVKFENKGTFRMSVVLASMFFLQNVIATAGSGFPFSSGDPDRISVPNIFAVSMGVVVLWLISNWGVGSLMDTEGKTREIVIVSTYSLLPYILVSLFCTVLSNVVSLEIKPFMSIVGVISILWSMVMMFTGMYQVHRTDFKRTLFMLLLTVFGMAVIVFILLLIYSLFQQVYIFLYTIFNELMFRM